MIADSPCPESKFPLPEHLPAGIRTRRPAGPALRPPRRSSTIDPSRNCSTGSQGQDSRQPAVDHQTRSSPIIRPLEQVLSFIQGFWPLAPGAPYSCAASTYSCAARFRIHWRADLTQSETKVQFRYLTCTPEIARLMMSRWISLVPSKMV